MRAISDYIGFLIILIIILIILVPLILYTSTLYYANNIPPQNNQEMFNGKFINITYIEKVNGNTIEGVLCITYPLPLGSISPQVINLYNYSYGQWVPLGVPKHSPPVLQGNNYYVKYLINGYAAQIEVEVEYLNQIYYAYLQYNTSAMVG